MASWLYGATAALVLVIALLAADVMGLFNNKNHFVVNGKVCSDRCVKQV